MQPNAGADEEALFFVRHPAPWERETHAFTGFLWRLDFTATFRFDLASQLDNHGSAGSEPFEFGHRERGLVPILLLKERERKTIRGAGDQFASGSGLLQSGRHLAGFLQITAFEQGNGEIRLRGRMSRLHLERMSILGVKLVGSRVVIVRRSVAGEMDSQPRPSDCSNQHSHTAETAYKYDK
ncbi:MAG: hypothetical protein D6791_04090 [Chloroflexi bacterium]|nr:MAG: hypothetical protein D6791_04090 [Chloroflexota bacterium]